MAQRQIAIEFAVLIKSMSESNFFPNLESVSVDMSDVPKAKSNSNWKRIYKERTQAGIKKVLHEHPLGKYFLDLNYSIKEICDFLNDVKTVEMINAVFLLLEE